MRKCCFYRNYFGFYMTGTCPKCILLKCEHFRILSDARGLATFPSLNGTSALEILRLDRAGITSVPSTLCYTCPRLRSL